jgi:hypothetical protein
MERGFATIVTKSSRSTEMTPVSQWNSSNTRFLSRGAREKVHTYEVALAILHISHCWLMEPSSPNLTNDLVRIGINGALTFWAFSFFYIEMKVIHFAMLFSNHFYEPFRGFYVILHCLESTSSFFCFWLPEVLLRCSSRKTYGVRIALNGNAFDFEPFQKEVSHKWTTPRVTLYATLPPCQRNILRSGTQY